MPFAFFLFFIIAVLMLGSVTVGPFSLRVYMTVLMLLYLLTTRKPMRERVYGIRRDYISWFLLALVMLCISLSINGGLEEFGFFEKCLSHYLVCIVAYFAIDRFVKEDFHFDAIVGVLSLIILFDVFVTVLQNQNNPIGWGIGIVFSSVEQVEMFSDYLIDHDSFVGVSKLPGIFGHPVSNGFFLSVAAPMLLTAIGINKSKIISFYYIATILVVMVAIFLLQQRAAFYLMIIVIAYHLLSLFVKKTSRFIIPVAVIIVLVTLFMPSSGADEIELGKLASSDNSSRTSVWTWAFTVFMNNPLFGNIIQYNQHADYSAHNVLIDSLVDSGIFGFIPLLYLYVKTVIDSLQIMFNTKSNYARVISYSVLISMGMGMFHNTSYMTGDVIIFISLGLMFKAQALSRSLIRRQ